MSLWISISETKQRYLRVLVDHRHECRRARSQPRARGRYHHVGCVGGALRGVQMNDDIEVAQALLDQ